MKKQDNKSKQKQSKPKAKASSVSSKPNKQKGKNSSKSKKSATTTVSAKKKEATPVKSVAPKQTVKITNKSISTKNGTFDYPVVDELPKGWSENKLAQTAPVGYVWVTNGESLFNGKRQKALIKEEIYKASLQNTGHSAENTTQAKPAARKVNAKASSATKQQPKVYKNEQGKVIYKQSTDKIGDILVNQAGVKYEIIDESFHSPNGYNDGEVKTRQLVLKDIKSGATTVFEDGVLANARKNKILIRANPTQTARPAPSKATAPKQISKPTTSNKKTVTKTVTTQQPAPSAEQPVVKRRVYKTMPDNYSVVKGSVAQPDGTILIHNGKPLFKQSKDGKTELVKDSHGKPAHKVAALIVDPKAFNQAKNAERKLVDVEIRKHNDAKGGHPHIMVGTVGDKNVSVGITHDKYKGKGHKNIPLEHNPLGEKKQAFMKRQGTVDSKENYGSTKKTGQLTEADNAKAKQIGEKAKQKVSNKPKK